MIVMAISLVSVSALEFSFDSPSEVEEEKEFSVSIQEEYDGKSYDVKIFVYEESFSNTVSEIYDGSNWRNPFRYLKNVFPDDVEFSVRVLEFIGETEICARLREDGKTSYNQVCNKIVILEKTSDLDNEEGSSAQKEDEANQNEDGVEEERTGNNLQVKKEVVPLADNSKMSSNEKIVLNPPFEETEPQEESKTFASKQEKLRNGVIYAFLAFIVILIILIALRKL